MDQIVEGAISIPVSVHRPRLRNWRLQRQQFGQRSGLDRTVRRFWRIPPQDWLWASIAKREKASAIFCLILITAANIRN
jgi:hypothetical protein